MEQAASSGAPCSVKLREQSGRARWQSMRETSKQEAAGGQETRKHEAAGERSSRRQPERQNRSAQFGQSAGATRHRNCHSLLPSWLSWQPAALLRPLRLLCLLRPWPARQRPLQGLPRGIAPLRRRWRRRLLHCKGRMGGWAVGGKAASRPAGRCAAQAETRCQVKVGCFQPHHANRLVQAGSPAGLLNQAPNSSSLANPCSCFSACRRGKQGDNN